MSEPTIRASAATPPSTLGTRAVLALCLLAESVVFATAAAGHMTPLALLGAHLAIVGLTAALLARSLFSGRDGGLALMGVLATLATGPFGALGALLLPRLSAAGADSAARLDTWYARIALSAEQDDFTRVSDGIAIGRAANLASPAPAALRGLFDGGPIDAQQTALGMIARHFHPDYLPFLKIALDSPEPVIRVQAAAVAARLREKLKSEAQRMLMRAAAPASGPGAAIGLAGNLDAMVASGLLEEATRIACANAAAGLRARAMARCDADRRGAATASTPPNASIASEAYQAHLLAEGRFAEFRTERARHRPPTTGRYRQRRVPLGQTARTVMPRRDLRALRFGSRPGVHL